MSALEKVQSKCNDGILGARVQAKHSRGIFLWAISEKCLHLVGWKVKYFRKHLGKKEMKGGNSHLPFPMA